MEDTYTLSRASELASRIPVTNVGNTERLLTFLAGAALLGYALKSGSKGVGAMSAGLLARSFRDSAIHWCIKPCGTTTAARPPTSRTAWTTAHAIRVLPVPTSSASTTPLCGSRSAIHVREVR